MIDLTIEACLELAIRNIQNNYNDEQSLKTAQTNLLYLCCGIVAGLKANKHQPQNDEDTDEC